MSNKFNVTSITLNTAQRGKLQQLADTLGVSRNATVALLIENAKIAEVRRWEPVATIQAIGCGKESPQSA